MAAWMLIHFGWRMTFLAMGVLGLVWVLLWLKAFAVPQECRWLSDDERDFILSETGALKGSATGATGALGKLLGRKTMWGLFITQGCCAYSLYLFLFWLPSYLVQSRHMELMRASWFITVPYLVATVLVLVSGKVSDRLLTAEALKQGKRRTLLVIFILLSSVILITNAVVSEYAVMLLISLALTFIASALTMNIAMANDLVWNAEMAGTALSVLILGGNCFGLLAPVLTGYIVKWTGSFDSAFYLAGCLLLLGALTAFTATRKPLVFTDDTP
jgi:ACS family glucarate transporter-like MFS transporter